MPERNFLMLPKQHFLKHERLTIIVHSFPVFFILKHIIHIKPDEYAKCLQMLDRFSQYIYKNTEKVVHVFISYRLFMLLLSPSQRQDSIGQ